MPFHFSSIETEWQRFLVEVHSLVSGTGKPAPKIFISYAWESSNEATEPMQQRLALLQRDLLAAGAKEVFLDINHMDGDLVETMRKGVNNADVILMICTPRYYARVQDEKTNAGYEFTTALAKRAQNAHAIVPIWWSGTIETAVPTAVRDTTLHDFRDSWARAQQLGAGEIGLLGRLFGLAIDATSALAQRWQTFSQQAFGEAPLPSILTPLKTYYQQQSAGRPLTSDTDLPSLDVKPTLTIPQHLNDVIAKAQGHVVKLGALNTHTTVLWHDQALSHQRLLMGIQDTLWKNVNQHQVIALYIPLQCASEVRGDIIAHYLQQRCGYSEADVLSLKQHYRFVVLLDNYDLLLKNGLRNVIKEADTLSWPAATIISCDVAETLQWRIIDNYLQRQGYAKATQLRVNALSAAEEARFIANGKQWQPIAEPLLQPIANKKIALTASISAIDDELIKTLTIVTVKDRVSMPNTLEAAWPFFLDAVKKQLQSSLIDKNIKPEQLRLFISVATKESAELITRLNQLQTDLTRLGITNLWLDTPENQQHAERDNALQQATHFLSICTPNYQQQSEDNEQQVAKTLQQAQQQQKSQPLQLIPLWFEGASFSNAVPKSLWSTLIRDMRDSWYYTHHLGSLGDPLGIIPALFQLKVGSATAQAYYNLYASFQYALPKTLSSQSPSLLNPLLRVWKEALATDGMMRPRPGCYVWPDIRKGRESEERDPLQAYWQTDILPRAKGEESQNNLGSASVYYLLGDSGSGKSTVLWEFSDTLWQQLHQHHIIPIRISLSNLTQSVDFLNEFFTKECGYNPEQIQLLKQQYRFLFLLDAYDELVVSQGKRNLLQQSNLLSWQGAIVITARTSSEQDLQVIDQYLTTQQRYANRRYVRDFTASQVTTYLKARAKHESALTPEVIAKIEVIPGLKELIANPLLLYLVADILPELNDTQKRLTRYDLYERFIEKWFGREFSRMIEEGKLSIPSQLSVKFEQALLTFAEEVAQHMFVNKELVVKPEQLSEQAAIVLSTVFQAQDTHDYLTPLRQASPLKPIGDNFQFMHKSFFEHLMARIIVALAELQEQERFSKVQQLLQHWPIQQEPQILYFLYDV